MPCYCHIIAFAAGFVTDLFLGDPHGWPHPVCLIGKLISTLERRLWRAKDPASQRRRGCLLVVLTLLATGAVCAGILAAAYGLALPLGVLAETVMTWQILAVKSLRVESMKVYECLKMREVGRARQAVSMIVGRDTETLDEAGIIRAAVETVAENTSDGVVAPMLYLALGGPVLGFLYKAVNTMDSMLGYKNDRYLYFGRVAARLDDAANFLPARLSALLMLAACAVGGREFDPAGAYAVYRRDRRKHASPNSAQTESVCAGALGIRLAGAARYFGRLVEKPYIGDARRDIQTEDIRRANRLMLWTAWLSEILCLLWMGGVLWLV